MKPVRILVAAALGSSLLVVAMPSAEAATITVSAGQSIQTAIDNASPGDTIKIGPGVFREFVVVYKDDLTIIGHNTIIQPPASTSFEFGMCISSDPDCFSPSGFVEGDSVSGITVQKSNGDGFLLLETLDVTLSQDIATGNKADGFDLEVTAEALLTSDQASGNAAGFGAEEIGSITLHNSIAKANCIGVAIVAADEVEVSNNALTGNTKACFAEGPLPATKGLGAYIDETNDMLFTHNTLQGNGKATSNQSTGGLVITDSHFDDNNVITENSFAKNLPVDIRTDTTDPAQDSFTNNACSTSAPSGLC